MTPVPYGPRPDHGSGIVPPTQTRDAQPVYPKHLIAARIQGVVTVEAIVDRAGCVRRATVVGSAHPELDISALAAVVQRRYAPPG